MRRNSFSIPISCYRVIRGNSKIGGHAYGRKRRIALLKRKATCVSIPETTTRSAINHHFLWVLVSVILVWSAGSIDLAILSKALVTVLTSWPFA
jgi:hypothetical protein